MTMTVRHLFLGLALATAATGAPAQQQSRGYKFLEAVRNAKDNEVVQMLDEPGQQIVNSRDINTREGALHIVAKRGDIRYINTLLQRGADPNIRDGQGDTPLLLAIQYGFNDAAELLAKGGANVNLAGSSGDTPLIRAIQKRDPNLVRMLLANGADPDQTDLTGRTARDYAKADTRSPAVARQLADAPKKVRRAVSGPKL